MLSLCRNDRTEKFNCDEQLKIQSFKSIVMAEDKSQVKIKFFTNIEEEGFQIPEAPLYVPTSLKRYGLSEIVNHLLGKDGDSSETKPVPFDFLVDGQMLRTSIDEYLVKNGMSHEHLLTLEYTRSVLPPSFLASFDNDDWISSIDSINKTSRLVTSSNLNILQPKILSGSYDGIVRIYNMSGSIEKQFSGHSGAIKSVKWISPSRLVSSGNDRQLRLWKNKEASMPTEEDEDDDDPEEGTTIAILEGHKAPVASLSVEPKTNRILSAGYDNDICFWSTNHKQMNSIQPMEYDSNTLSSASKKRKKLAVQDSTIRRRSPLSVLQGHKQPVEDVAFDLNDNTVGYSVSQDHTIKTWDLVTSKCVDTRTTGFSLLSLLQVPTKNLIVTGSSARHINLHDPRITNTSTNQVDSARLVGHDNFVVGLSADPKNDNLFASCSHDGMVKVWDIRSVQPLYTITREESKSSQTKIFDVCWDREIGIVSGGLDKKLQINKGSDITKD